MTPSKGPDSLSAFNSSNVSRYQQIVDEAREIIYRISPDGHFTFVNPTAAAVVRRRVEDCLGLHFLSLIRPDYREKAAKFYSEQVKHKNSITYFEFPAVGADGIEVWIGQTVQLIVEDGQVVELQGLGRDINDRKNLEKKLRESEQRYRLLFEANPHPTWVYALDTLSFLAVNNAAVQNYGYTANEFQSMTLMDIRPTEERSRLSKSFTTPLTPGTMPETWKHLKKDGTVIDVEINAFPIVFDGRQAELITATDVSARLRAEEQLRHSQKMEAVGRLAGGVAHDFNNLLTAITGYAQMTLRHTEADSPLRRNVEEIQKASNRAAGLTRQLLAFSRKQVLQPTVFDLNSVVSEMEKMLRRVIGENIELVTKLEKNVCHVKADQGQMEQVLMNLVVNARDAMTEGGRITIETARAEREPNHVHGSGTAPSVMLIVSDNGMGMDAATQKRIFDPFFTTKQECGGTGLGLSIVYGIVKQSGGHIEVHSQPGKGSSFRVCLPRVDVPRTAKAEHAPTFMPNGTETVLLVEDEQIVRKVARLVLETSGYDVLEADSGPAAIDLCIAKEGPIHLLLSDVVMPRMNGVQLQARIKFIRPEVKTLFMSGYEDNLILQDNAEERAPFLQKPFSPEALTLKVREVLDGALPSVS